MKVSLKQNKQNHPIDSKPKLGLSSFISPLKMDRTLFKPRLSNHKQQSSDNFSSNSKVKADHHLAIKCQNVNLCQDQLLIDHDQKKFAQTAFVNNCPELKVRSASTSAMSTMRLSNMNSQQDFSQTQQTVITMGSVERPTYVQLEREVVQLRQLVKIEEQSSNGKNLLLTQRVNLVQQEKAILQSEYKKLAARCTQLEQQNYLLSKKSLERQAPNSVQEKDRTIQRLEHALIEAGKHSTQTTNCLNMLKYKYDCLVSSSNQSSNKLEGAIKEHEMAITETIARHAKEKLEWEMQLQEQAQLYRGCLEEWDSAKSQNHKLEAEAMLLRDSNFQLENKAHMLENRLKSLQYQHQNLKAKYQELEQDTASQQTKVNEMILNYEKELSTFRNKPTPSTNSEQLVVILKQELTQLRQQVFVAEEANIGLKSQNQELAHSLAKTQCDLAQEIEARRESEKTLEQKMQRMTEFRQTELARLAAEREVEVNGYTLKIAQKEKSAAEATAKAQKSEETARAKAAELQAYKFKCKQLESSLSVLSDKLSSSASASESKKNEQQQKQRIQLYERLTDKQLIKFKHKQLMLLQLLIGKANELDRTTETLKQTERTLSSLKETNQQLSRQWDVQNLQIREMTRQQKVDEELIIRMEETFKAKELVMERQYQEVLEKYLKYKGILVKEKERKTLHKAILEESKLFTDDIVLKCKNIVANSPERMRGY